MKKPNQYISHYRSVIILVFILLIGNTSSVYSEEREDVVIASSAAVFSCKGGDPANQSGSPPYSSRTVFNSLVGLTQDGRFISALAESFQIAPGWKYIDFFIREGVTFHNGDPFSAEDVKYSFDKYMDRKSRFLFRPMWKRTLQEVEIVSPKQVRVHFKEPDQGFLHRLWWGAGMMPKAYREKIGDEEFANKPIGTGPFKWVDYKQDQWIKLESVDKHFLKTPRIKTIRIVFVPEPSTRLAMLKAGEADMGDLIGAHAQQINSEPGFKVHWVKYISGTVLIFADLVDPGTPSPFHDIRVRKAVSMSIDREIICEKILFRASEPWGDVMSPISLGHDPNIKPTPYDPETAKKLLAEAGYPKGFETEYSTTATNVYADAIAASLDEIGIKVRINKFETGAYLQAFFSKKLRGLLTYGSWYDAERSAPADLSDFYSKGAYHAYNPTDEIDAVLRKANYAETDKELEEWGRKISQTIRDSMINTVLWANHRAHALGPKIKSWSPCIGADPAIDYDTIEINK